MKKLEISQMENLQGGLKEWSCKMVWAAAAFVFWGALLYRLRFAVSPLFYGVIASACIWIYSIAACRSYHRYIGQAVTAIGLIALAYFYKPGIPGFF